jgi:membrane associated rhomboid family serine protease
MTSQQKSAVLKGKMDKHVKDQPSVGNFRPKTVHADRPQRQPMINIPTPVAVIIVVLFAMHFLPALLYRDWHIWRLAELAFSPARFSQPPLLNQRPGAEFYTMLTHGLLHANMFHLVTNSIWLLIFGTPVSRVLGSTRFFVLLALSTVAGALFSLFADWNQAVLLVGASGGISGLISASMPIIHAPDARSRQATQGPVSNFELLSFRNLLNNYRALWFVAVWLAFTFLTGAAQFILPTALIGETRVAWEAHLGGFFAGFALVYLLAPRAIPER